MGLFFGKLSDREKSKDKRKHDYDDEEYDDGMDLLEWDDEDEQWEKDH